MEQCAEMTQEKWQKCQYELLSVAIVLHQRERSQRDVRDLFCAFVATAAALLFCPDRDRLAKMHPRLWNLTNYYQLC